MSRALGIPYTTYRGYEENRTNDDFLRLFARKFGISYLWLLAADDISGPGETKISSTAVTIDPGKGVINSGQYIILQMPDDSMEPTISRVATVGVLPIKYGGPVPETIVAIKTPRNDGVIIRRLVTKGRLLMGVPDNPRASHDHPDIKRQDILGKVIWQFSVM